MSFPLSFLFIVCACNISIWRKVRKRSIALQHQNRAASQNQRLTRTLLFVSAISVLSWLPLVIVNFPGLVQEFDTPILFLFAQIINILNFSNSILNPLVYALRIPEFRQTLILCCSRRQAVINRPRLERKENIAVVLTPGLQLRTLHPDSSQVQKTFEQKTMDTKLWSNCPFYIHIDIYCKYTMDYSFHEGTSVLVKSKLLKHFFSTASTWDNRKHHSTSGSNEWRSLDYWWSARCCLVMLDLSAAFGTLDHTILLYRVNSYFSFSYTVLRWFSSYLAGQKQYVIIGNTRSSSWRLEFGVLQGSILGPLLFTLYSRLNLCS